MDLLNQKVKHKAFGEGVITSVEGDKVEIEFNKGLAKTFKYPDSFEKFIVFIEEHFQENALDALSEQNEIKQQEIESAVSQFDSKYDVIKEKLIKKGNHKTKENHVISKYMAETTYDFAKRVYKGDLTLNQAKLEVEEICDMKPTAIHDYIMGFSAMMNGQVYKKPMKNIFTKLYIEHIQRDFGDEHFRKAITATRKHIKYYEDHASVHMKGKRQLVEKLSANE